MPGVRFSTIGVLTAGLLFGSLTGCQLMHEFQPHRLHRWNRGPGMTSGAEAYYSVRDPVPTATPRADKPETVDLARADTHPE
jgi:hypothetical protein